jgi:hypothetical protein
MMPYVRMGSAFRRGMGQTATCGFFTNLLCSSGAIESVMGTPCTACATLGPSFSSGAGIPTAPTGYNAQTGTVDSSNTTGETGVYPYAPVYPDNPGGPTSPGGAAAGTPSCDISQANWLDYTTWCPGNWFIAAGLGAGLLFLATRGKH